MKYRQGLPGMGGGSRVSCLLPGLAVLVPVTPRPSVASLQHVARHLLAWLAIIGTSGCSLALDGPKPNRPKNYAPKCDDSKGLVVADGLLATAVGIGSLSAFGQDEPSAGVILGLIALGFTASAVRGNGVVNECREEQALFAQENVPFAPPEDEDTRPTAGQPVRTANRPTRPPVATAPEAPADPYSEPRSEPPVPARPVAPARPPTSAPATIPPPTPAAKPPAPAAIDPDAWRDFWTEVP